jgi:hypothetical protein
VRVFNWSARYRAVESDLHHNDHRGSYGVPITDIGHQEGDNCTNSVGRGRKKIRTGIGKA